MKKKQILISGRLGKNNKNMRDRQIACKGSISRSGLMFFSLVLIFSCAKLENTSPEKPGVVPQGLTETQKENLRQLFFSTFSVKCVDNVVSFNGTDQTGFERAKAFGPPLGAGQYQGSIDTFVTGESNTAIFEIQNTKITDGTGADFKIFENGFEITGNAGHYSWDFAWVEISNDNTNWYAFPISNTGSLTQPAGKAHLVGIKPVLVNYQTNSIDPRLATAGGDAFDIADAGKITNRGDGNPLNFTVDYGQTISEVRYIKVTDGSTYLPDNQVASNGTDIDAICAFHFATMP